MHGGTAKDNCCRGVLPSDYTSRETFDGLFGFGFASCWQQPLPALRASPWADITTGRSRMPIIGCSAYQVPVAGPVAMSAFKRDNVRGASSINEHPAKFMAFLSC
jgi:hypothetical protein